MKVYGIYVGFDFVSIASCDIDTKTITPLFVYPIVQTLDRQKEISAAFKKIASKKIISSNKSSAALLSFESPQNQIFITNIAKETPDIKEMASWELFMRTDEAAKDYNISVHLIQENKYLVAAAKKHDIEFYTTQVKKLGLAIKTIEPSIVSALNLFEMNCDTAGENLIALLSCHKIIIAYLKDGKLIDIAQNTICSSSVITSENIMKVRAEITQRNKISQNAKMYITGDLLADKEYSDNLSSDIKNCLYINPFDAVNIDKETDPKLTDKYSHAFGISVSLLKKTVEL